MTHADTADQELVDVEARIADQLRGLAVIRDINGRSPVSR
jgi:hypothetical protein